MSALLLPWRRLAEWIFGTRCYRCGTARATFTVDLRTHFKDGSTKQSPAAHYCATCYRTIDFQLRALGATRRTP